MDLAYDDPPYYQGGFKGDFVYPWTIDGLRQKQIQKMLSYMTTAANAYMSSGKTQAEAFERITKVSRESSIPGGKPYQLKENWGSRPITPICRRKTARQNSMPITSRFLLRSKNGLLPFDTISADLSRTLIRGTAPF